MMEDINPSILAASLLAPDSTDYHRAYWAHLRWDLWIPGHSVLLGGDLAGPTRYAVMRPLDPVAVSWETTLRLDCQGTNSA